MALSFSRPDPSQPSAVSSASFALSRRGFDQAEVRDFLRMVAAELARLQERERMLEHELRTAQRSGPSAVAALDEEVVTRLLGEEAARILQTARDGAATIRQRAEEHALRLLREATDEAHRIVQDAENEAQRTRQDAATDAESELAMAKQHGREMVTEVRAYRERVLGELARRRELAREQIEQLAHGRDRLVQAFERARLAAVDVLGELAPLIEPDEYVNLSPTTGPVPLMVPNTPPPAQRRGPAFTGDVAREPGERSADAADLAGPPAADVPDAPAVATTADARPAGAPVAEPADAASAAAESAPAAEVHADVGEAAPTRIFDVEIDDPELASAADRSTPVVDERPARRVPGVIERPAAPANSDAPPTAAAPIDAADRVTSADHSKVGDPVIAEVPATVSSSLDGVAASDEAAVPDAPASAPERPARQGRKPSAGAPAESADREPRAPRAKKSAPLPRETVVERPGSKAGSDAAASTTTEAADDDRPLAPVVSLFSGATAPGTATSASTGAPAEAEVPPPPAAPTPPKSTVDDLFARLRAARTETVAESVGAATEPSHPAHGDAALDAIPAALATEHVTPSASAPAERRPRKGATAPATDAAEPTRSGTAAPRTQPRVPAIFQASPAAPAEAPAAEQADDSPFGRREASVAPLIVSAARALKRVLADEQNDVLSVLRRREPVRALDALVPAAAEHIARYTDAIADEFLEAAVAGAASMGPASRAALEKSVSAGGSVRRAAEMLANQLVDPLRERIDRAVADAGGANADLAEALRALYREWKTQHIDRQVDEAVRMAYGHGALSGVAPGTKICWLVDPNGPPCADADDNALGGPVSAGQPFPTDHLCAPAHAGCRCMLAKADR